VCRAPATILLRVVHLLGDRERIDRPLNDAPLSSKTETVHQEGKRGKRLGYAPP